MKHVPAVIRLAPVLCAAAILCGCANLQAVRDFTKQSAQLAAYRDVTETAISNPATLLENAPPTDAFKSERALLEASAQARAQRRDSVLKVQGVVAGYMGALANLAGEDTFSLAGSINKVEGALVEAPEFGIKAETVSAFAKIAAVVSNWVTEAIQVKEVKAMINKHGDAMDRMLAGMEDISRAMLAILEEDQKRMANFKEYYEGGFGFQLGPEQPPPASLTGDARTNYERQREIALIRRDAARLLVSRSNAAMMAGQRAAVESAAAALAGVQTVRAGHTEMRNNVDKLTSEQVTAQLRRLAADLQEIRDQLRKL